MYQRTQINTWYTRLREWGTGKQASCNTKISDNNDLPEECHWQSAQCSGFLNNVLPGDGPVWLKHVTHIQDVNEYMLQCFVVDRWVQSYHILGDVIVVLHYKSCSKWWLLTSLHVLHRLAMLCWTLWKILGISRTVPAATAVPCTRLCCVSTGVSYTRFCMYPQWSQVRRARGPGYWAFLSNPSVAKVIIQILTGNISAVCRVSIMLEPHFTTDFQRYHFQQLG
jgi:hypothetical protein